ncbi:MAG: molybdenum ABC transporter ATP-binding protein [Rhodothermales bacterium]
MSIVARFRIDRGEFSLEVDFTVPGRGVTAIFGPSGCGKTTLLRAIAGLEPAPGGYLKVGETLWQGPDTFLAPHERPIGYVFQEPSLFAHLDVRRNLEYGLKRLGASRRRVSLDQAITLLGIGHLLARRPDQLSGGEQQRVAMARALAVSPSLLLLDEPLAALDAPRKAEVLPYLESLHRELDIPVLYVSHARQEVARLADHMMLMADGRMKASGGVHDLFSRLDLDLARGADAETVISAVVGAHDETYGLTYVEFPGGRFAVAGKPLPLGSPVRLQVLARDVSLTLERPSRTSILNIFPATVEELGNEDGAQVTVRVKLGSVPLLSRITRKSAAELDLHPGAPVFAQVKSVALLV